MLVVRFAAIVTAFAGGLSVHQDLAHPRPSHAASAELALARIPNGVSVAATPSLLPHLSQRVEIYSLPEPFVPLDWGGSLALAEFAERARGVRFVAYLERDISPSGATRHPRIFPRCGDCCFGLGSSRSPGSDGFHILERPLPRARTRSRRRYPLRACVCRVSRRGRPPCGSALRCTRFCSRSSPFEEFRRFETQWDLAIYDQLLWLLAHGHEPFSTVITRPMLEAHFQPALVLLTPLYWLDLGVPALLTAQSIGLALTAPALFALARHVGASPALAALPAFLWLVCPFVASVNLFEFRPDPFAPALIVLSVLAGLQGRHVLLVVTTVLALSLKEDISLTYVMLGLLLFLHGRRRVGAVLALGSAAWYLAAVTTMNLLGGSNEAFGRRFAGDRGDSVGDAFVWMLEHPFELLGDVTVDSLGDLALLLISTGCLALLAPSWMLLSLPTALHNALSAYGVQHDLVHHYHLGTLTGLFVASAVGVGRLQQLSGRRRLPAYALAAVAALVAVGVGRSVHDPLGRTIPEEATAIERALERIPEDASVAATWSLVAHLSQRVEVYSLRSRFSPPSGAHRSRLPSSPSAQGASGSSPTATSMSCLLAAIRRLRRSRRSSACYVDSGSSRSTASDACTFSNERRRSPRRPASRATRPTPRGARRTSRRVSRSRARRRRSAASG